METKTNNKKKFAILFATFVVPLLFFLFLASGKVNFNKLPILTEKVENVPLNSEKISLHNKVSVVSFLGSKSSLISFQKILNLYQVIYKSTNKYRKFQIITIVPEGSEEILNKLKSELKLVGGINLEKWSFLKLSEVEISKLYSSFESPIKFDFENGVSEVYIVDEELHLRGRTDDEETEGGLLFGYNTGSVAELKNKLREDLKVIFYESKFAVKAPKLN